MNDSAETRFGWRHRDQAMASASRQPQDAGTVNRRWWESEAGRTIGPGQQPEGGLTPPPPPPPLNPEWFRAAVPDCRDSVRSASSWTPFSASRAMPENPAGSLPAAASPAVSLHAAPASAAGPIDETAPLQPGAPAGADGFSLQRLELELAAAREEAAALQEMLEDLPEIFERKFQQRLQSILEQQQRLLADNQTLREQLYTLAPAAPAVETRPSRLLLPATQPAMSPPQRSSPLAATLRRVLRLGAG